MNAQSGGSSVMTTRVMTSTSSVDEPLELARRLHDTVAQRLAGLSYLLSMPARGQADALARCRAEVDAALDELRDALMSVGSAPRRNVHAEALAELRRLREQFPDASLSLPLDAIMTTEPRHLVFAFVAEGLRNARKH